MKRLFTRSFPAFGRTFWQGVCALLLLVSFGVTGANAGADVSAQVNAYPKKINFRNIMQNQDIAIGEVEAITQDHEGFIWLGGAQCPVTLRRL